MKSSWRFDQEELKNLHLVLQSGNTSATSGDFNKKFEEAFSAEVGANYGITFNSGTSTLHAALHALGIGYGDEVIMPALTVYANLAVTLAQNAIPIFIDVNLETFNMDMEDLKRKISKKTKCIMAIPLYGCPCDYDELTKISKENGIPVINDAAQSIKAIYKGKPVGSLYDITSYSFDATKHMTTGDGGMITCQNKETAGLIRKFGSLGYRVLSNNDGRIRLNKDIFQDPDYSRHDDLGLNYRMSEFAAAVGLAQTKKLDSFVKKRQEYAKLFDKAIENCEYLIPQKVPPNCESSYWTYAVRFTHKTITWKEFRLKFIEFGGDGIYAAWKVLYQEEVFQNGNWKALNPELYSEYQHNSCKIAEIVQKQIMQFVLSYENEYEAREQTLALEKTIAYFESP